MPCGCTSNQSGGLLRRGTFVAQRRTNADVIVVDVGGAADGTAPYQRERFRAILKGEAAMQVAAHNLGAAEANFGVAELRQLHSETKVPLLSANAKGVRKPLPVKRHILVSAGTPTQRVLLTGVLSPEFATEEIDVSEPADAVLSVLESVTEDYDRLVVLAYLPVDDLRQLAKTLPEADVIIGGPTGQALSPENIGRTTILSATNKGKFLAEVSFTADQPVAEARVVEMSPKFEDHAAQTDNLTAFRKLLAKRDFTAAESGLVDPHMLAQTTDQKIVGTDSCKKCHDQTSAHWETTGHAHAWQRLVKEEGHVDPYCQQCHTTGYGLPGGFSSLMTSAARHDVGCESCHGPSSAHVADSSRRTPFDAAGICLKCHDPENSPHFEFDSYWEKVRHE